MTPQIGGSTNDFEMVIVGAGFAGLHMLHRALKKGLSVRLYEAGSGVGGTWYWNRYPGARVDIESFEYSYSFSEELEQEWKWTERYSAQPELLRYAECVTDKFGLRPHIQFDTRVTSAVYDEASASWDVGTSRGGHVRARFCVMATGLLSAPNKPKIEGLETFTGPQYQTSLWPKEKVDFTGERVAVIGTGSSGVQSIPEIAKQAKHLTVFQRTAAYAIPARNAPVDRELERRIKANYPALREREKQSFGGFINLTFFDRPEPMKAAMEVTEEERRAGFESRWKAGGLALYTAFTDLLVNKEANERLAEWVHDKIRSRVKNQEVAEKLIPKGYPILTKRLCADTNYYETYDRENVTLVDLTEEPIERITPRGIVAGGKLHECDAIVFATGFDAMSGALDRIDIRGRAGRTLKEHWKDGLTTFLGMMCSGFPNMFYMNGPGSPSAFFHPIMLGEYQADWILRAIDHLRATGTASIEPDPKAEEAYVADNDAIAAHTLFPAAKSWYMGDNIPGKPRRMLVYCGGFPSYQQRCEEAAANGFQQFRVESLRKSSSHRGAS
jgi:cation diffusion facilitator CzcD-associated flavoprotein CzcO